MLRYATGGCSGLNPSTTAKGGPWRPLMDETDASGLWGETWLVAVFGCFMVY